MINIIGLTLVSLTPLVGGYVLATIGNTLAEKFGEGEFSMVFSMLIISLFVLGIILLVLG